MSHQGRGGMGSHKHGISGHSGPNGAVKRAAARIVNREAAEKQKAKAARKQPFTSVTELFKRSPR